MARAHRIQFPGIVYHVFSRGNEKMDIYRDDPERKRFMKFLSDAKEKYDFKLYAYVLMSNHYHLLIEPCSAPLSKIMQILNSGYARFFNWKNNRVGHLFQGRYKNVAVQDNEYFFDALRYIHLNPVRKRMVETVDDYKWSSHGSYMSQSENGLVDKTDVLKILNKNSKEAAGELRLFIGSEGYKTAIEQAEGYLDRLAAGSREFAEELFEKTVKRNLRVPARAFRVDRAHPDAIISKTADVFNVSVNELINKRGKWNRAKKAAVYLLWKNTSLPPAGIAVLFKNMHPSNIKRTIESAEKDMNETREFERRIKSISNSLKY